MVSSIGETEAGNAEEQPDRDSRLRFRHEAGAGKDLNPLPATPQLIHVDSSYA